MHFTMIERLRLDEPPTYQPRIPFEGPKSDGAPVDVESLIAKEESLAKTDGFRFVSISDYYHKYRSGALTPNEVAENVIRAMNDSEKLTPKMRAMIQWNEDEIRKMAVASTERFQQNKPLSVMDGVPVSIKDEFECIPYILRVGTSNIRATKGTVDATLAAKLRSAGAIIIGTANMHELGTGTIGYNISKYHGTPRNPYNVQHYTGGSSSGSGASVAAGLCPVSIGTDGGGSVRIPAVFCGVVGFKGTFGRFSAAGCAPLAFTVSHMGPLCSSVRDAAIVYGKCMNQSRLIL
ncbi:uncharacterized protein [Amphiura filiformis]|uniref:uncharacterized protein n=1 Tax=Amphiura filiformis TaxID=82378 RepID=UPI003B21FD3C